MRRHSGGFDGLLAAGHSRGAQLLAKLHFVEDDHRIRATCAISAPLCAIDNGTSRARLLMDINSYLPHHPTYPLVQIIPKDDWYDTQESMTVRPHDHCHYIPGYHINALYNPTTHAHFEQFLAEFH